MDVDIVKTSSNNNNSMDMMAMMMQQMDHQKFPDFSEPFYNNQDNEFFHVNPNNVAPNLIDPPQLQPPPSNINFANYPPSMMAAPPVQASEKRNSMAAMREMIFRIAVMQPIHIDPESVKPPKRRNVKISKDPQSVAARHRRERISERIRILQRLVPGGTKMDTASMLDEAIHYVKFLKKQVQTLEQAGASRTPVNNIGVGVGFSSGLSSNSNNLNLNYSSLLMKGCQPCQMFGSTSQQLLS